MPDSDYKTPVFPVYRNGKSGAINPSGSLIIPLVYKYILDFQDDLAVAESETACGILHSSGEFYPCNVYTGLGHGLFSYKNESLEKKGLMDANAQILTGPIYDHIYQASDGLIVVAAEGKWGAIDYVGNPRIALKYSRLGEFSSGLAPVSLGNGRYGYITKEDEVAVEPRYLKASSFNNGSALVCDWDSGNSGFIDCRGKLLFPMDLDWATLFSEGLASAARERAKIGFINEKGDWVIPPTLKAAAHFSEGLAPVSMDWYEGSWGFMDRDGVWKIPSIYNRVGNFQSGICFVNGIDEKTGEGYSAYIDQTNQMIWGPGDDRSY